MPRRAPRKPAPARRPSALKILHVASEVEPFAKTGGLADVTAALPKALQALGHDVRLIMPRYRRIDPRAFGLRILKERVMVSVGPRTAEVTLFEGRLPETPVPVYFVDAPRLFDRDGLYQDHGEDFPDNLERFSAFAQAVLLVMPELGWRPDLVHCHDWQTALLCAQLALNYREHPFWGSAASVLTVHNLAYQGLFPAEQFPLTHLPAHAFGIEGLEFYGKVNLLKGGLLFAEALSTVSPTYAREIQTHAFGAGLDGVLSLRRDCLVGILNGIDVDVWNPSVDPTLPAHYRRGELAGKSICKLSLQKAQGLAEHHGLLIGMVQRLVEQKGIELFVQAIDEIMALPVQVVILGTGDSVYHERLTAIAGRFPDRIALHLGFDDALAHQIEAGCDAFLMPSRFEPCGLNQMYSMRYGTLPIVRQVGGLADTVVDVSPSTLDAGTATGFVFEPYTPKALVEAISRAVAAFRDHDLWRRLVDLAMQQDFSWSRSANAYDALYRRMLERRGAMLTSTRTRASLSCV